MNLFQSIHQIVFHGKGGYDFDTIYNLPIWLRKFIYSEIKTYYDKEKEEYNNAKNSSGNKTTLVNPDGTINKPEFLKAQPNNKNIK
jgi:hypothetical protein